MRWLGRSVLALLALIALAVPALWIGRDVVPPRVLRWAINHAAGREVVDDLAFRIDGLSLRHVGVVDLSVNADRALVAERVRLEFEPAELLRGRLRTATVIGASLAASLGADGAVGLGSLDPLVAAFAGNSATGPGPGGGGTDGADDPPALRRLELRDARVQLAGAAEGQLRLEGTLAPTPGGMVASLPWRLDATTTATGPLPAGVEVAAEGRLTLDQGGAGLRASLGVDDGRLRRGALDLDGLHGTAVVELRQADPPVVVAALTAERAGAGDAELPTPYLHVRADGGGLSATVRLGGADDPALQLSAVADPADTAGDRRFRADGWADLAWLDALLAAWTDRPALDARGTAHAELAGRLPAAVTAPAALWNGAVASGGVSVVVAGMRLPAPAAGTAFGTARLALALAAGRLAAETASPAVIDVELEAPPPGPAAVLGSGRVHVEFGAAETPFRATLLTPFAEAGAELAGPVRLSAGAGAAALDGSAALFRDADGWRLRRLEQVLVTAEGFGSGTLDLHELDARIEHMEMGPYGPEGLLSATVKASAPDNGVVGASVSFDGRIASDVAGSHLLLDAPGRVAVDRLTPSDRVAPLRRVAATIGGGDRPVATLPADGGPFSMRLPLALPALRLDSAAPGVWGLAAQPMRVVAEATVDPFGSGQIRARLGDGTVEVSPAGVVLEGLAADLRLDLGEPGLRLRRIDLHARRVADRARLARFTPLSLEGFARAAGTAASPDRMAFRMTLRGADGAFVLDADGHHAIASGRGAAELKLFPIRFVPGGLQPADLSPAAAAMFRDASGEVSLGGRVRWPGEAVPPDDPLTLVLDDLGFTGSLGTVTGLQGSVALSRIDPPATPPGQLLTATAVDVGVPVVAPRIRFRLEPESVLRLESVDALLADGRVTAADVAIPLGGEHPVPVVLTVEGVDAARLAEALDIDGLAAAGTLSGWLPLLWDPEAGLAVRQARLVAGPDGGSISYSPEGGVPALQDSGEQVSLLLDAIRNFVYTSFEVEADGRPGEPFDVKIRLRGANPDLYDGYPIALNVTLTGALDQLFGNLRRSLGLTDLIQRRLEATAGGG